MARLIRLNDGTEVEVLHCGASGGYLQIEIPGGIYTVLQLAELFFDQQRTARIAFIFGGVDDIFEGYTGLEAVSFDRYDQAYRVTMRKEA